jgi:hypothetical protein
MRTTVCVVPLGGAERAPTEHAVTPSLAETMVDDQTTPMAAATANAAAKDEALPEPELPTAQEPAAGTTTAFTDIPILVSGSRSHPRSGMLIRRRSE